MTKVMYLEIVSNNVDETCSCYEKMLGIQFSEPVAALGGSRTASTADGGRIGVRGPLSEVETPVVRPYWLVEDIEASVEAAAQAGAEIAHPAMELPGEGTFAVLIQGGAHHGLWQN